MPTNSDGPTENGNSLSFSTALKSSWMLVMSDSEGPVERLSSKSSCFIRGPIPFQFATADFFGPGDLLLARWRAKSKSRSIEDSASVSLDEDTAVQTVAELPLLSDELEERPKPKHNEGSTSKPVFPPFQPHFRFTPFDIGK